MADVPAAPVSAPVTKVSLWRQDRKPWWAPDAQGFTILMILCIAAICLFYRMTHPSDVSDKMLETMLTIMFGTALVAVVNYLFGSSRGSADKDEALKQIAMAPSEPPK
jgi:hypothetical protein